MSKRRENVHVIWHEICVRNTLESKGMEWQLSANSVDRIREAYFPIAQCCGLSVIFRKCRYMFQQE